jgi:hypothetical protein
LRAINAANSNGDENTISLESVTYTLTSIENDTQGSNGLPPVSSALSIVGAGAADTVIERDNSAPEFRIIYVSPAGGLRLDSLSITGGKLTMGFPGSVFAGGILNDGTLTIVNMTIDRNLAVAGAVTNRGVATVSNSIIAGNEHGQGILKRQKHDRLTARSQITFKALGIVLLG